MAAARRKSPAEQRQTVRIRYRVIPYFAIAVEEFPGTRGVGETPFDALVSMRRVVRSRYPADRYDLNESIANPDFIKGWRMPEMTNE